MEQTEATTLEQFRDRLNDYEMALKYVRKNRSRWIELRRHDPWVFGNDFPNVVTESLKRSVFIESPLEEDDWRVRELKASVRLCALEALRWSEFDNLIITEWPIQALGEIDKSWNNLRYVLERFQRTHPHSTIDADDFGRHDAFNDKYHPCMSVGTSTKYLETLQVVGDTWHNQSATKENGVHWLILRVPNAAWSRRHTRCTALRNSRLQSLLWYDPNRKTSLELECLRKLLGEYASLPSEDSAAVEYLTRNLRKRLKQLDELED